MCIRILLRRNGFHKLVSQMSSASTPGDSYWLVVSGISIGVDISAEVSQEISYMVTVSGRLIVIQDNWCIIIISHLVHLHVRLCLCFYLLPSVPEWEFHLMKSPKLCRVIAHMSYFPVSMHY